MDHVVYLDAKEKELEKLFSGEKSMIIRGAAGRELPHGRVFKDDVLWFIENSGNALIKGRATVKSVYNSEKLTAEESERVVLDNQDKLRLSENQLKRWAGKRYLVLIELENIKPVEPFLIDRSEYGNMDDWLPVGEIERVRR